MKQVLLIFLTISVLFSQDSISVYINSFTNKFNLFERKIVEQIINLHNRRSKVDYVLKFIPYSDFGSLFEILDKSSKEKLIFGINSISITEERLKKYSFSTAYLISKPVILSKKYETLNLSSSSKLSYTINSIQEQILDDISALYSFEKVPYSSVNKRYEALIKGKEDYGLGDYNDYWIYGLNLVHEFDSYNLDRFGIIFPKNSILYNELSASIDYYLRSPSYFKLIKANLGVETLHFVKKNLK